MPFLLLADDLWYHMHNSKKLSIVSLAEIPDCTFITLDPRLQFPDSVGGIFPGPATIRKVYHQGIKWFSQLAGLQSLTVLSMLIRGITITLTGDWHSRRLAALSPIMLHNSLLTEGKI